MRKRPITALVAALALLAVVPAASRAQDPTPTPTPTATATAQQSQDDGSAAEAPEDASKEVKAIYTDYSRDGVIDVCAHTLANLQAAEDSIEPDFDRDFPDFREAVEAGIQRHESKKCDSDAEGTATPTATASPAATATASPDSGALPPAEDGSSTDDGAGALPPATDDGTLPPEDGALPPAEDGAGTDAVPPAAAPTVAPSLAAATPTPVPAPVIVTRSGIDGLMIPGILIGIALLGAGVLAATAIGGRRSPRMRHAWSEAGFRTRSLWADFSDWLRIGR